MPTFDTGNDYTIISPEESESEPVPPLPTDGRQVDLTEQLEIDRMRSRVWYFEPGGRSTWHKHDLQEELYVLMDGPAQMQIGDTDTVIDVPEGSIVRVPPETPRQLLNDTDDTTVWFIVGAPPDEPDDAAAWDENQNRFVPVMEWFS